MDKVAKLEKELIACDVIEPVNHIKIISTTPFAPECPMIQRPFRKVCKLIFEISCHHIDHALVSGCHIILLEYLERNHLWPPVLSLSSLKTLNIFTRNSISEVSIIIDHGQHGLCPDLRLGNKFLVTKKIRKRHKTVKPIWTSLPGVAFTADPGIVRTDNLTIKLIQVTCHAILLLYELVMQPALRLDCTNRKFSIISSHKRQSVEYIFLGRHRCPGKNNTE